MSQKPLVSIVCKTYNHENYIEEAIKSFINQNTNFEYEIIIHDDASTDQTQSIIKRYQGEDKRIKSILQVENQNSQGLVNKEHAWEQINQLIDGDFVAVCEGDDFFLSDYKLQKQVDFLIKNPDYSMHVHAAYKVDVNSNIVSNFKPFEYSKTLSAEEVILGGGGLVSTNSMMMKTDIFKLRPQFIQEAMIGDYPKMLLMLNHGKIYYDKEILSSYRIGVPGSWTTLYKKLDFHGVFKHYTNTTHYLGLFNDYSEKKFQDYIAIRKSNVYIRFLITINNTIHSEAKILIDGNNQDFKISRRDKIKLRLLIFTPRLYKLLQIAHQKIVFWRNR